MIEKEMLSEQHREPPLFGLPATGTLSSDGF